MYKLKKKNINQPFIVFELHSFEVHLGKKSMSALFLSGSTVCEIAEEDGALFKSSLVPEISSWAARNRSTRISLNEILSISIKNGHEKELPKDGQSLLHTPAL